MRVQLDHGAQLPEASRSAAERAAHDAAATSHEALGKDQAQFSGIHAQVQALAGQASQLPEVRMERVQVLRQALLAGQYRRAPEEVATALAHHMIVEPAR